MNFSKDHVTEARPEELKSSLSDSSTASKKTHDELTRLTSILAATAIERFKISPNDKSPRDLATKLRDCHENLEELRRLKKQYDDVPLQTKITLERIGIGEADLEATKSKMLLAAQEFEDSVAQMIVYVQKR